MDESILNSIKKALGLSKDYHAFDFEIIMHINSALSNLTQLGVGPADGFAIEDDESEWDDLLNGNKRLSNAKSFVYLKVRMLFDPPGTQHLLVATEKLIEEETWRLAVSSDPYLPQTLPLAFDSEVNL